MADRLHSAAPPTFSGGCGSLIGKRYRPGAVVGASVLLFGGPRSPGELAEAQSHHPDIYLAWGQVKLTIWTHKIDGLTESDFVMAAKADKLLR